MDRIAQYYKLVELQNSRKDMSVPFYGTSMAKYRDNLEIAYLSVKKKGGRERVDKKVTVM